jgi:hypothetical protein
MRTGADLVPVFPNRVYPVVDGGVPTPMIHQRHATPVLLPSVECRPYFDSKCLCDPFHW